MPGQHRQPTTTRWMNGVCEFSCDQPPVPFVVWLNLFNAELSPERYRRGQRSHELGEEGDWVVAVKCQFSHHSSITRCVRIVNVIENGGLRNRTCYRLSFLQ